MILTARSKLADTLVLLLATKPDQCANELRAAASRSSRAYSCAAIYKELGKLVEHGVVVKQRDRFSLSFSWIHELQQFLEQVRNRYQRSDYLRSFLPVAVGRHVWRFNNLMSMDDFWNQILLALVAQSPGEDVFSWVPHPWFVLIHTDKERKLHSALRQQGNHFYTIFGNDGYLDRLAEKLYHRSNHTYSFAPGPFEGHSESYFDIIGDYLLTVRIEDRLTAEIESLFHSVRSKRELDPLRAMRILTARGKIRMTLERNPKKSSFRARKFREYFGMRK